MKRLLVLPIILPIAILVTSCSTATTSAWRPLSLTNEETPAAAQITVWIRDDFIPRTSEPDTLSTDFGKLPPDSGAIIGICSSHPPYKSPTDQSTAKLLADEQITIRSKQNGIFVTRSDENGLFIETFTPGDYEISCRGRAGTVSVKKGKTSAISLNIQ